MGAKQRVSSVIAFHSDNTQSHPSICSYVAGEFYHPALLELVVLPFGWVWQVLWRLLCPAERFADGSSSRGGGSALVLQGSDPSGSASVCSHLRAPASSRPLYPQKEWNNSLSLLPTTANLEWYRSALWALDRSVKQKGAVCCWLYFFSTCSRIKFNFYVRCLFFKVNLNTSFPLQFL